MTSPYLGEIQILSFGYAPMNWAIARGDLVGIQQATLLYSYIGVSYGGDGMRSFRLPDMTERVPCGAGQGVFSRAVSVGESFGEATVSLSPEQTGQHFHSVIGYVQRGAALPLPEAPGPTLGLCQPASGTIYVETDPNDFSEAGTSRPRFHPAALGLAFGEGQPHENRHPVLALNYVIALQGAPVEFA